MRSDEFIDLYKQLEDELEAKYSGKKRSSSSVVFEYIKSIDSAPVRDELNVCREIRNLIAHTADIGGEPVVEPSEQVILTLKKILEFVKRPPLALEFATPFKSILSAHLNDDLFSTMAKMEKRGFSHIPIIDKKRFVGVFSVSTIFSCVLHDPDVNISEASTIRDLARLLPPEQHMDNYVFVDADTTREGVKAIFNRMSGQNRRVSVIFITQHGRHDEPLLGMLTPWDIMKPD